MLGGVPHQGTPKPTKTRQNNKPANCYKRGKLFQRFHSQNADGIGGAGDNLSMASDSQANQQNQTEGLPAKTTLKRKAALLERTSEQVCKEIKSKSAESQDRDSLVTEISKRMESFIRLHDFILT